MDQQVKLPFSKSHAFLIGINEYEHVSSLSTAVKDATDIAELLQDETKHGYEVHLLTDAGKNEMEAFFNKMKLLVKEEDRVIFYYAGHGIAKDSEGDPEGFLVPADAEPENIASLIPMKLLHETLSSLPCKHGLLILDCCFAGAFKWSTGFRSLSFDMAETLYAERFWRFVEHPAWQVITSSAHDQKAADVLNKEALGLREEESEESEANKNKNSPFAWALKQAIDLHSKADVQGFKRSDGVITATELYIYLREIVETATLHENKRQSPALFTLGKHDSKGEYIFINPGHKLNLPAAPDRNPYKGLSAFEATELDSKTFFGREDAIKTMAKKLKKSSILLVSAPSGQGKSSVIKAGLFPAIKQEGDPDPIILKPADRAFHEWNILGNLDPDKRQIVLLDQYEGLFNLEEEERDRLERKLIKLIRKINEADSPQLTLILTLRFDFEWQLSTSEFGQHFWQEANIRNFLYRLPPMTQEELREIMVKPAWAVAYEFESEELVNQILEEINHSPGALPLLSFTLHKLYEERDSDKRLLTRKAYVEKLGGVNGALSKHADGIYEKLPSPAHQDFMRKLMIRMVRLNDGSYSGRKVYLETPSFKEGKTFIDELDYPDHLDKIKDEVLSLLEKALLVVRDQDSFGIYVEPMHDSLLNFWPRCLQWIQDFGRENLVLQRQLWQAVVEHHQWEKNIYSTADGREAKAPLWDNNPKLQQVQIAVTDPKNDWLCKKGWADKSISSISFLLWERKPSELQMKEMEAWNWFFQENDEEKRYQKIQAYMDHWLNEEELAYIQKSFEEQRSELERAILERNEALEAKKKAQDQLEKTVLAIKAANNSGGILKRLILDGKLAPGQSDIQGQLVLTSVILSNEEDRIGSENTNILRGYYDADLPEEALEAYLKVSHDSAMRERSPNRRHLRMQLSWISLKKFEFAPNAITYLQFFLCDAGFLLQDNIKTEAWGIYGYETLAGIRFFQEYLRTKEQLTSIPIPNGVVDAHTWKAVLNWAEKNKRSLYSFTNKKAKSAEYKIWFNFLKKLRDQQETQPSQSQQLIEAYRKDSDTKKIADWQLDSEKIHLIGIRRNQNQTALNRENDDLFILLIKGQVYKFWGSTDPNPKLARRPHEAYLAEGQHAYRLGWYKVGDMKKVNRALRPATKGVLVFRDMQDDNALKEDDRAAGLQGPNPTIPFNWSGNGTMNWSAGNNVLAGASYLNPDKEVVDCQAFVARAYKGLSEGKTRGAFNVFMDLLTINTKPTDLIYYNLISENDLSLDPQNFPSDYTQQLLEKLNPFLEAENNT